MEVESVIKSAKTMRSQIGHLKMLSNESSDKNNIAFLKSLDVFRDCFNYIMDYLIKDWEESVENKYEALLMFRYKTEYFKGLDVLFLVELRFGDEIFIKDSTLSKKEEYEIKIDWYKNNEMELKKLCDLLYKCFGIDKINMN